LLNDDFDLSAFTEQAIAEVTGNEKKTPFSDSLRQS
jgi:hypothetical protein